VRRSKFIQLLQLTGVLWCLLVWTPVNAFQSNCAQLTSAQIDALWTIDDPAAGLAKLRQALATHPGSADELHTQICRALGLQRKFAEGWAELAKVSADPSPIVGVRVQLESGRLKNTSGDPMAAKPYFTEALELARQGRFDYYAVDAAHMLAIVTSGKDSVAWGEKALSMADKSKDPRAQHWKGSLLNNLGWTYHDEGDYPKALAEFKAAEAFQTKFGTPVTIRLSKWAVARCLRSLKMYQAASDILQELLKFPEAGYASEELGEDLLALGRADEAKPYFKKAFELLSQDLELRDHDATRLKRLHDLSQ
jgi:tetratricopeptide (TPR) repeat protein